MAVLPRVVLLLTLNLLCCFCAAGTSDPLVCSCTDWNVGSRMCKAGDIQTLEYWDCAPGWVLSDSGEVNKTGCERKTICKDQYPGINIATRIENTLVFRVLVSQKANYLNFLESGSNAEGVLSNKGVTWSHPSCIDSTINALKEQVCYNELIWKGRTGTASEDEAKYSCITSTMDLDSTDKITSDWSCEYPVCRVLCTTPTLSIKSVFIPLFNDVAGLPACAPGTFLDSGGNTDSCYILKAPLHIGETLNFELSSSSVLVKDDIVDVQAAVEPGIPIGLEFARLYQMQAGVTSEIQYRAPLGANTRSVFWTPHPGQQGKSHLASFVGYIAPQNFYGTSCPLAIRHMHIQIEVPAYDTRWLKPQVPKSLFGEQLIEPWNCKISGHSCNGRSDRTRDKKCENDRDVSDPGNFCGILSDACCAASKQSTADSPADDLVFNVAPGELIEGLELVCQSTVMAPYQAYIELLNVSVNSPTRNSSLTGRCSSSKCDSKDLLGGWEGFGNMVPSVKMPDSSDPSYTQSMTFEFKYQSKAGQDEGFNKRWCFSCGDSARMYPSAIQCIRVETRLCEIYVQKGDSLQAITRAHNLDRNWRRIWNINSEIANPYKVMHGDTKLRLGPLYTVREGDTMMTLAARFQTTLKRLLSQNPHIDDSHDILPGLDICVVACTNRRPSDFVNPHY